MVLPVLPGIQGQLSPVSNSKTEFEELKIITEYFGLEGIFNFGLMTGMSHVCTVSWTRGILLWAELRGERHEFTELEISESADLS